MTGDGCVSIEHKFGLSASQFFGLNPELKTDCTNLARDAAYCVRAVGQISAPVPPNAVDGTDNKDCARYDTVIRWVVSRSTPPYIKLISRSSGDSCASIEGRNGISNALFLALNPEVFANCTNIQLGGAYCVQAVPTFTITTAPPSSTPSNVAPGTDTKARPYFPSCCSRF